MVVINNRNASNVLSLLVVLIGVLVGAGCVSSTMRVMGTNAGAMLTKPTSLKKVLADPAAFEGGNLTVKGTIGEVDPEGGTWMTLTARGADGALRVEFAENRFTVPVDAAGHQARAFGEFSKNAAGRHVLTASSVAIENPDDLSPPPPPAPPPAP